MAIPLPLKWQLLKDEVSNIDEVTPRNITVDPNIGVSVGAVIYADTWNSIVGTAQNAARYCSCHCNYCTCQCNYCTCNCNYCTCKCDYCTCDCNYCTCNCNHACVCKCNYHFEKSSIWSN